MFDKVEEFRIFLAKADKVDVVLDFCQNEFYRLRDALSEKAEQIGKCSKYGADDNNHIYCGEYIRMKTELDYIKKFKKEVYDIIDPGKEI